jgi:hypothetical protein
MAWVQGTGAYWNCRSWPSKANLNVTLNSNFLQIQILGADVEAGMAKECKIS